MRQEAMKLFFAELESLHRKLARTGGQSYNDITLLWSIYRLEIKPYIQEAPCSSIVTRKQDS